MQEQVKKMYLDVIKKTMQSTREAWEQRDDVDEATMARLDRIQERWTARLLASQEFTDDPLFMPAISTKRRRGRPTGIGGQIVSVGPSGTPVRGAPTVNGSKASHSSRKRKRSPSPPSFVDNSKRKREDLEDDLKVSTPKRKREDLEYDEKGPAPKRKREDLEDDKKGPEPKRKREDLEDDTKPPAPNPLRPMGEPLVEMSSDLGGSSTDEDSKSIMSEEAVENYVLAEFSKVQKSATGFRAVLKDGVAHINGRDYPFGEAKCMFKW